MHATNSPVATDATASWARFTFAILLAALALLAYLVPYYDWDLVAYVGAGIALHEHNPKAIQSEAYAALRDVLPQYDYRDIAEGSAFRRDVAGNADHFSQQLRFYNIRPLYIRSLALLHGFGLGWVQATRLISALSFFLLGLVLFVWARQRHVPQWEAAICVPLLMLAPVMFMGARTGSPDAFAAVIVTAGVYCLIEGRYQLVGIALLLVALLARTDQVIFVFLLLTWSALRADSPRQRAMYAALAVASVLIVFAINHYEHSYSWQLLMQNTANPIANPAEVAPSFSASDYFAASRDMVDEAGESSFLVFVFIAAAALFSRRLPEQWASLLKVVLLSWALHLVVFPHMEDRYFVAGSAVIGFGGLLALSQNRNHAITEE